MSMEWRWLHRQRLWALVMSLCTGSFSGALRLGDRKAELQHAASNALLSKSAAGTKAWRPCGSEGGVIEEEGLVRFGWGLSWTQATVPRGASCALATFGSDPAPNIRKVCECTDDITMPRSNLQGSSSLQADDLGVRWARCADEGDNCECSTGFVRFGTGARWLVSERADQKAAASGLLCSAQSFGGADPAPGNTKECWCEMSPDSGTAKAAVRKPARDRVAMVMLSRRPPDLKTWLQYHLNYMGVDHVFMDVEDTPHFDEAWRSLSKDMQQRVTVWKATPVSAIDKRPSDDYTTLQNRQLTAMRRAREISSDMKIDWLLHIDDDELLYTPLHRTVGEVLAQVPTGFDQAYLPNVEAVYESADVHSCFTETTKVNMNRYAFVSYANGKAAVRVSAEDAVPAGPHQWRTSFGLELSSIHMDRERFGSPLIVVHFESCPFTRWEDKFWELGNTSPEKIAGIPFRFYRESIETMKRCRTAAGQLDTPECSEAALKTFWSQWKTKANPEIGAADVMPIAIPWAKITASL
mmetsp:Transcript_132022/g.240068  ORF Transcript_132022/g.240068 Transcript_132022/m.240068 type:complete len:525 (+) Transcript_132022:117-1691(+)